MWSNAYTRGSGLQSRDSSVDDISVRQLWLLHQPCGWMCVLHFAPLILVRVVVALQRAYAHNDLDGLVTSPVHIM